MARPADPTSKDALIAAARAEFARRGLRGARIEDITAACDLLKGVFYLHFESKEALFALLVGAFIGEIKGCSDERAEQMQSFLEQHGQLTPDDFQLQTGKFRAWDEQELQMDLRTLEIMWRYRDVVDVLISGVASTPFEKTLWELVDAEQARIAEQHRNFQHAGCLRSDVAPELFGAMVIGTYLLVGKQMARAAEKPDLASMARTMQKLIREGSVPRGEVPQPRTARDARPSSQSPARRKPRKGRPAKQASRSTARRSR